MFGFGKMTALAMAAAIACPSLMATDAAAQGRVCAERAKLVAELTNSPW